MSKILEVLIMKLSDLDDCCAGVDAEICFEHRPLGFIKLSVPPTARGRETLKALLIEIGRHEQNKAKSQSRIFNGVVEGRKVPTV